MGDGITDRLKARINREILDIENRADLTDDQKASQIIYIFSGVCAGVAVQPIPFADIFVLTPIQAYMGTRIGAIRGLPVIETSASDLVKEIAGVVGLGLLAQQLALGAYKTFLPFLAGFTTIPLVFGLTYAIGQLMDEYYRRKAKGQSLTPDEMRKIWSAAKKKGEAEGTARRSAIEKESQN